MDSRLNLNNFRRIAFVSEDTGQLFASTHSLLPQTLLNSLQTLVIIHPNYAHPGMFNIFQLAYYSTCKMPLVWLWILENVT